MPKVNKDMIPVHYVWIGPPSGLTSLNGVAGHDTQAMIQLWHAIAAHKKHQLFFWCLDEFVSAYSASLFECIDESDNPIYICSIEDFLAECMEKCTEEDELIDVPSLGNDAKLVMHFMNYFLNRHNQNSSINDSEIADRVSCKELFFLFLLRTIGGYVLDTNVAPGSTDGRGILERPKDSIQFMLPAFHQRSTFKNWLLKTDWKTPLECFECWALYSSGENDITRTMVRFFVKCAGYELVNEHLIKAATLHVRCQSYLKKEDIFLYGQHLLGKHISERMVRRAMHNARGFPIMLTITEPIKKSNAAKHLFFNPSLSVVQFIKVENLLNSETSVQLIAEELNIIKTYYNSHAPQLAELDSYTAARTF